MLMVIRRVAVADDPRHDVWRYADVEHMQQANAVQESYEQARREAADAGEIEPKALPAVVAAALPVIARCVQGIIPWKWMADKLKKPIATAVLWIIIKWNT